MTPKQFCKKYGVKVTGKWHNDVSESASPDGWAHTAYKATLKYRSENDDFVFGRVKFKFRMGLAHTEFDRWSALYGIGTDAAAGEHNFLDYCEEFGEDSDSRESHKTWKACRKMRDKLYAFCSSEEMYEDLKSLEY